jgi:hypothetical protein
MIPGFVTGLTGLILSLVPWLIMGLMAYFQPG